MAYLGRSFRERPLNSVVLFDQAVAQSGVIAKPALRNALPFLERVLGTAPSREQLLAASKLVRQREEDIEIRLRVTRRVDRAIHLADAPLGVRVRSFLLAPDGGG